MTPRKPRAFAATKVKVTKDFVTKKLLQFKPVGTENYGDAFQDADSVVDRSQDTVIIFMTDGDAKDNGAKEIVQNWASQMKDKLRLFCITLGPQNYKNGNSTVKDICEAASGKGKMVNVLTGNELGLFAIYVC